jgi:hypothetical protein
MEKGIATMRNIKIDSNSSVYLQKITPSNVECKYIYNVWFSRLISGVEGTSL